VRPHTVRRPRPALGDAAATRVGFFGHSHNHMTRDGSVRAGVSMPTLTRGLAFTRYSFAPKLSCTIQSSLHCPLHLHCSHYCNTIARRMRNIRPPPDPPCVCNTPYNIGSGNIVYRPTRGIEGLSRSAGGSVGVRAGARAGPSLPFE